MELMQWLSFLWVIWGILTSLLYQFLLLSFAPFALASWFALFHLIKLSLFVLCFCLLVFLFWISTTKLSVFISDGIKNACFCFRDKSTFEQNFFLCCAFNSQKTNFMLFLKTLFLKTAFDNKHFWHKHKQIDVKYIGFI